MKRKRVRFDFSPTVSLPTVPTQDSITEIESRTVQSVRCFPPRKPVSPCGLDGKSLGNLDDGYVATKASGRRKEQEYRVRENDNNENKCLWFSSSLAKKKKLPALSFTSRRVRIPGQVNGQHVSEITVDTASDVSCVASTFLQAHSTLRNSCLKQVPPDCMSLRAANGSPIHVLGFVTLQITLGDVSRPVDALVIPSLGPDQILLDNATMARFGAVLNWKRQRLNFLSSKTSIPTDHCLPSSNVAKSLHTYVRSSSTY